MAKPCVGIIGAGQLGRMMALAGYPLGVECRFLDGSREAPGGHVAPLRVAAFDDAAALGALARDVDVLTFDIENVPIDVLDQVAEHVPVLPQPQVLAAAQDRLAEKRLFRELGIPTAAFVPVEEERDLGRAGETLGWPIMLKTRRMGYDGRGQRTAEDSANLLRGWRELGSAPAIAEKWVDFERELSLIGVRSSSDAALFYPLSENVHGDGQLVSSIAPYEDEDLSRTAEVWLGKLMSRYDYRGVLTVEFFHTEAGLVANEFAPRVHNSGHWTIEGAETSQFENHLRAILGWPLGDTAPRGHSAMVNLLGALPDPARVLALPGAHFHDYGKQPRPRRKLGHCTMVDTDRDRLLDRLAPLRALVDASNC